MKIRFLKLKNWLLMGAAGLLGVNLGCDRELGGQTWCEYGVPEIEYEVKGRVTNRSGEPIAGIVTKMADIDRSAIDSTDYTSDTTDADGRYDMTSIFYGHQAVKVEFKDVDGPANGEYADTSVNVLFQDTDHIGGDGHWYLGHATKELDVTLREK